MPPPISSESTLSMKFSSTPILSLTFAPPSTATSGLAGDSSSPPSAASSASTRKPATDGR